MKSEKDVDDYFFNNLFSQDQYFNAFGMYQFTQFDVSPNNSAVLAYDLQYDNTSSQTQFCRLFASFGSCKNILSVGLTGNINGLFGTNLFNF
jgi:hypothetical protein